MTGPGVLHRALWTLLPAAMIVAIAWGFLVLDPLAAFRNGTPPVEELTIERTVLDDSGIHLTVRAGGSAPMAIAQVQVDGAYWRFQQTPPGPIARLESVRLDIPYPWVHGEAHHLALLTGTGAAFEHTIDVAVPTPAPDVDLLWTYGLVGLFVGVVPVALGMLFFPALRAAGPQTTVFVLALTLGLLAFLLVDTMAEALEIAAAAAGPLAVPELVWLVALAATAGLMAAGRRHGGNLEPMALAGAIALGIGLHNLGEGLAIGSAFASGAAALGSFLVIGFTLHNITEGVGIVAPLTRSRPSLPALAGLAALAGLPAVAGLWAGAFAFQPHWAALALAVGAGAILQVIVEVGLLIRRRLAEASARPLPALAGGVAGVALMYLTALIVPA